jgi:hypothetical protein
MATEVCLIEHPAEKPSTDFRLTRLCEWAGYRLQDFQRTTLDGSDPRSAIAIQASSVLFPMGPQTYSAMGLRGTLAQNRGYLSSWEGKHLIPSNSPGFIQRGQAKWSAAFINDLQKAVELAHFGLPAQFTRYALDPSPMEALDWAKSYRIYLLQNPRAYLAFDIETPGKPDDEEEADTDSDAPDRTWTIERIGFSYQGLAAISFAWAPEYMAAIRLLLGSPGDKVVWNAGFDVPRIRRAGVEIVGLIHDGMVAWHILHSDLPKRLGFVATFTCPWQPAWKHLSGAKPAYYNATDADVELRSMEVIESELKKTGLWQVYQSDVLDLEPILVHMQEKGMPVDAGIRLDRATKLDGELRRVRVLMEAAVPLEARRIEHVYKKPPADLEGLRSRPSTRLVPICPTCGADRPRKDHFKSFKKKSNPCAGQRPVDEQREVVEYYRLAEFTPSRDQLIRYHQHLKRNLPTIFDKKERKRKISFGERQLKDLTKQWPDDKLYVSILTFRELQKLASAYIGYPVED